MAAITKATKNARPATTMYLDHGFPERAEVIAAIALVNRAINMPEPRWGHAMTCDTAGHNHLVRARGELVRALMPPAERKHEFRALQHTLLTPGPGGATEDSALSRALQFHVLELHWAMFEDESAKPGGYYFKRGWEDLDQIGIDPDVLR